MFEVRLYCCPDCSSVNEVASRVMSANEVAGAETWGICWSCSRDFQLTIDRQHGGGVVGMIAATRSPIGSNVVFRMWQPWSQRTSGAAYGHR